MRQECDKRDEMRWRVMAARSTSGITERYGNEQMYGNKERYGEDRGGQCHNEILECYRDG